MICISHGVRGCNKNKILTNQFRISNHSNFILWAVNKWVLKSLVRISPLVDPVNNQSSEIRISEIQLNRHRTNQIAMKISTMLNQMRKKFLWSSVPMEQFLITILWILHSSLRVTCGWRILNVLIAMKNSQWIRLQVMWKLVNSERILANFVDNLFHCISYKSISMSVRKRKKRIPSNSKEDPISEAG